MSIKDLAKKYAIKAHYNQIRKSNGKPMIYHPLAVGDLLEDFGYDDDIISAGYLHDTVEDTQTTLEELESLFNKNIAKLVSNASEPDKSLSWEERKMHTINMVKNSSLNESVVILADKIHNIEDLTNELKIQGISVFNHFKRGIDKQLWYFEEIYNSVPIEENDSDIVKRYGKALENLKIELELQNLGNNILR